MSDSVPVALVTGAAHRLGNAIARRLHADGLNLALHFRTPRPELETLRNDLEAARPGSTVCLQAELDDATRADWLIAQTIARFGRLDALINNASTYAASPVGQVRAEDWDRLFASNARAPFFLAQAAAPFLAAQGGAIVNMTDIQIQQPRKGYAVYTMAKAALDMATRALALELAPQVRVNAVAPGAILWEPGADQARRDDLISRTPLARTGTPEEVAEAVRWLLRDAPYITGQTLAVDGGRLVSA